MSCVTPASIDLLDSVSPGKRAMLKVAADSCWSVFLSQMINSPPARNAQQTPPPRYQRHSSPHARTILSECTTQCTCQDQLLLVSSEVFRPRVSEAAITGVDFLDVSRMIGLQNNARESRLECSRGADIKHQFRAEGDNLDASESLLAVHAHSLATIPGARRHTSTQLTWTCLAIMRATWTVSLRLRRHNGNVCVLRFLIIWRRR